MASHTRKLPHRWLLHCYYYKRAVAGLVTYLSVNLQQAVHFPLHCGHAGVGSDELPVVADHIVLPEELVQTKVAQMGAHHGGQIYSHKPSLALAANRHSASNKCDANEKRKPFNSTTNNIWHYMQQSAVSLMEKYCCIVPQTIFGKIKHILITEMLTLCKSWLFGQIDIRKVNLISLKNYVNTAHFCIIQIHIRCMLPIAYTSSETEASPSSNQSTSS